MEQVVVVNEINLDTGGLYACDLDKQWVVGLADDDVHSRESYHLVQLVASLVDVAKLRHEGACLVSLRLEQLGQLPIEQTNGRLFR